LLAAGNPEHPSLRLLLPWIDRLDAALDSTDLKTSRALTRELKTQTWEGEWENACRRWWILALCHHDLHLCAWSEAVSCRQLEVVNSAVGVTPDWVNRARSSLRQTALEINEWADEAQAFLQEREWSDAEEWVGTRRDPLLALLAGGADWAKHIPCADLLPRRKRKTGTV
jgi:hypothetical protein